MNLRFLPLLLLIVASPALAQARDEGPDADAQARERRAAPPPQRGASLAESVRRVERATGGQILSAERVPFDGRDMNRIKVLDATGRVRVITEDPQPKPRRARDDD